VWSLGGGGWGGEGGWVLAAWLCASMTTTGQYRYRELLLCACFWRALTHRQQQHVCTHTLSAEGGSPHLSRFIHPNLIVHVKTLLFPAQVSDKMDPAELVSLIASLNPDNTPGRLAVIVRMGAEKLRLKFPALIEAVEQAGQVRWQGVGGYCSLISLWRGGCYWRGGCSTGSCQRLGGHEPSQPA
jgi:hypothetical protein